MSKPQQFLVTVTPSEPQTDEQLKVLGGYIKRAIEDDCLNYLNVIENVEVEKCAQSPEGA